MREPPLSFRLSGCAIARAWNLEARGTSQQATAIWLLGRASLLAEDGPPSLKIYREHTVRPAA